MRERASPGARRGPERASSPLVNGRTVEGDVRPEGLANEIVGRPLGRRRQGRGRSGRRTQTARVYNFKRNEYTKKKVRETKKKKNVTRFSSTPRSASCTSCKHLIVAEKNEFEIIKPVFWFFLFFTIRIVKSLHDLREWNKRKHNFERY